MREAARSAEGLQTAVGGRPPEPVVERRDRSPLRLGGEVHAAVRQAQSGPGLEPGQQDRTAGGQPELAQLELAQDDESLVTGPRR